MLILLTLFRSNVCWAKPNHAFFTVNSLLHFFFQHLVAMHPVEMPQRRCAMPRAAALRIRSCNGVFKKALLLCCFFCDADKRAVVRCTDGAAHTFSPQCAPPVRQLKIFYPPSLPEAPHKQKCANLLRGSRPMRASACAANGMHCTPCPMLDARDAADILHRLHAISSRLAHVRNPAPRWWHRVGRCGARRPLASAICRTSATAWAAIDSRH